ncbi:apoptosis-associated speck-like protein containing a CARD isoform X2 [Rana temporaria]|uniref:apoptosis-associated speck-like protein containing a CARD isoform X2 n=1 Tax=Rana temporaria TaxID=8407 RepID=UPI001AAC9FB9|nr:apoptosis-associated speck-like protein containing a CARD isoform X2 [Rana temporaria]
MARTVRDELLTALEDLGEESFEKFCAKIRDWEIKEGYTKIRKRKLEKAKPLDVVDVILSHYTAPYGPELTVEVLDAIDEKDVALALKKALEKVEGFTGGKKPKEEPPSTSEASAPEPQEDHLVYNHQEAPIARVALVSPILDFK